MNIEQNIQQTAPVTPPPAAHIRPPPPAQTRPPPPHRAEDFPPRPPGEPIPTREVLREVGQRAAQIPPDKDVLMLSAAAARYALISLEAAREIAAKVRETVETAAPGGARSVAAVVEGSVRRDEMAQALLAR